MASADENGTGKAQTSRQAASPSPLSTGNMEDMSKCLDQFSRTFEASARRWELIVYPSLLAFIVLAAYGFYLIYRLTNDVDIITTHMDHIAVNMDKVATNMDRVSERMADTTRQMSEISEYMAAVTKDVENMRVTMGNMDSNMGQMNQSMSSMSVTMYRMGQDTAVMGRNIHNISGPMRFMNSFVPW